MTDPPGVSEFEMVMPPDKNPVYQELSRRGNDLRERINELRARVARTAIHFWWPMSASKHLARVYADLGRLRMELGVWEGDCFDYVDGGRFTFSGSPEAYQAHLLLRVQYVFSMVKSTLDARMRAEFACVQKLGDARFQETRLLAIGALLVSLASLIVAVRAG